VTANRPPNRRETQGAVSRAQLQARDRPRQPSMRLRKARAVISGADLICPLGGTPTRVALLDCRVSSRRTWAAHKGGPLRCWAKGVCRRPVWQEPAPHCSINHEIPEKEQRRISLTNENGRSVQERSVISRLRPHMRSSTGPKLCVLDDSAGFTNFVARSSAADGRATKARMTLSGDAAASTFGAISVVSPPTWDVA